MKRLISLVLSLIMLISASFTTAVPVQAKKDVSGGSIFLGEWTSTTKTINIENEGDYICLEFTPLEDGLFVLSSTGDFDTECDLYQNGHFVSSDDDKGEGKNFCLAQNLKKNVTYTYKCGISRFSKTHVGSYTVKLEKSLASSIELVPLKPITVIENEGGAVNKRSGKFEYDLHLISFKGSTFIIRNSSNDIVKRITIGNSVVDLSDRYFLDSDGHRIDYVSFYSDQVGSPWTVDGNNYIEISYLNFTAKVPVKVVNNNTVIKEPENPPKEKEIPVTKKEEKAKINASSLNISLSKTSYEYNGEVKSPGVIVKDSKGNTVNNSNYTISYSKGRKNVGDYFVNVTFKGDYTGNKTLNFKIIPKKTSISKLTKAKKAFTVKWKKQSSQTTGYQIQYATDKKFTKNKKTVTVKSNKTTSKKITKLKSKKTYYVKIRTYKTVDKKKYYSSWSKTEKVKTK